MEWKGSYSGLVSYKKSKDKKVSKRRFLEILFIIVVLITVVLSFLKRGVNKDFIKLSEDTINYYIQTCDEVSLNKGQLNWQEVAVVYATINNGTFEASKKEDVIKIGNNFFEYNSNTGEYKIKTLEKVLKDLGAKGEEIKKAKECLVSIEDNYLNTSLAKDQNKKTFIKDLSNEALNNYKEYGILPSITIAQAILESGWGESELSDKHNNLFGIKADESWSGKKIKMKTKENYDDFIEDYFRVYRTKAASIEDHGRFLNENIRYKENGVFEAKNYKDQAKAIEKAGYSTANNENGEPIYANSLIDVIQRNNLMLYDTEVNR
ncbi:glycoside hydrolase family 73 protein [Clostridium chauvoei]|uniref:Glycoside hydrolase family 73 protein n=2 Tax=Clostridium chauvoei TaxID=46867 RepID=A0ABD4RF46_9CLOT|nr:glycoside hydrolase family 73 protein [Clostridium chauvoei]ATD54730.1 hypothetical protein BTM20_05545 [Clostridium chauvoei]ATD57589.1 hypothetical protein BTM21_07510 [Clostridium chauvoei]MBX7280028.1 glycoside hydrolase family 73 protein [Clostridium chauvoei]MBX7282313.1 glycoside hydrolase family 73 protein [Clostridium chauvoei]MBX7284919.1 glycoside hydrolase family 73 protein [Clostridium chauvoei]